MGKLIFVWNRSSMLWRDGERKNYYQSPSMNPAIIVGGTEAMVMHGAWVEDEVVGDARLSVMTITVFSL